MVNQLKTADFKEKVLDKKGTVLVDMYADWCGPCKMLGPVVAEVSEETEDVDFYKVNVDDERSLAVEYKVMSIPTLLVFKDGELVKTSVGFVDKNGVKDLIK